MLLKTNLLKEQKDEYLMQIETDDQVEVIGPKHKHRIEKIRGVNHTRIRNNGDDHLGESPSKAISGNDSIVLKAP
tara:strand:+ start:4148 stop:4372 length:225 start_codon:yes stop_codon:yes gene_type:complete